MTCKEKIDEIEKILNDEHEVKIGRIRRIVEDVEDKKISLEKVKKAREEMENEVFESLDDDGSDWFTADKVSECMAILDRLIESEEGYADSN